MRMHGIVKAIWVSAVALSVLAGAAQGTTLIRADLDKLVAGNSLIVVGEVLNAVSYWNKGHTFILTDVTVQPVEAIKGRADDGPVTVTLMGGSVGDLTTLILGGPELITGRTYLMFLNAEDLPGKPRATTVRDLCQGVYDIRTAGAGKMRAVSQANRHPLMPDEHGYFEPPGGIEGFPLDALLLDLRTTVQQMERKEVNP